MDWSWLVYLMCPLMMIPMFIIMLRGHSDHGSCNHSGKHHSNDSNHNKNNRLVMLCCIVPIVIAAMLLLTGSVTESDANRILFLLILLCPLSHLVIMPILMRMNKKQS